MSRAFAAAAMLALVCFGGLSCLARGGEKKPPIALAKEVGDIDGIYFLKGGEGDKVYYGVLTVKKLSADIYRVQWTLDGDSVVGAGVRLSNVLSVGWVMPNPDGPPIRGTTLFTICACEGGHKMTGRSVMLPTARGTALIEEAKFLQPWPEE